MRPTTTTHALLGLLAIQPWSTYELAKQIDRSLGWFWPRTERKIYDEAKRLVAAGLATASAEPVGNRRRTVYSITPEGRRALARWLAGPSQPMKLESEGLVRVFFADGGDLDQLRATLTGFRRQAESRLEALRTMIAAFDDEAYRFRSRRPVNALGLRFQLDHHQAARDWAEWALAQIDTWESIDDPGDWDWRDALS